MSRTRKGREYIGAAEPWDLGGNHKNSRRQRDGCCSVGYTLAAVAMLGTLKFSAGASLIVPLLIMALPILDTTQVVVGRLARGIRNPLGHPDKTHLHHRLLAATGGARRTALIMWFVALVCGVVGMAAQGIRPLAIVVTVVFTALSLWFVAYRRVRAHGREETQITDTQLKETLPPLD